MTADNMAQYLKVNDVLMKELLKVSPKYVINSFFQEAEIKGYLCRDESLEGVRYYDNPFLKS